jgi:DNA repair ATPase RecN
MLTKILSGLVVLLLAGCAKSTPVSIDSTPAVSSTPAQVKLDGKDCASLVTTTYDLESAVLSALAGEADPGALQTMNQLLPVFEEMTSKYSANPQTEAGIWLEQITTDLALITEEMNSQGKLSNTQASSQLMANIDKLDQFCPSEE